MVLGFVLKEYAEIIAYLVNYGETLSTANCFETRLEPVEVQSEVQTEYHGQKDRRLLIDNKEKLYLIAQETLTNGVRHAQANQIIVFSKFDFNLDEIFQNVMRPV